MMKMNVIISISIETIICQYGTPNGILIIMETGEVNGIMESQIPNPLSGLFIIVVEHTMATINGIESIVTNWLLSVSLSTMPPTAAKSAAYNKNPNTK